jgi:hypothetical protein
MDVNDGLSESTDATGVGDKHVSNAKNANDANLLGSAGDDSNDSKPADAALYSQADVASIASPSQLALSKWKDNKKLPRIFTGLIFSTVMTVAIVLTYVFGGSWIYLSFIGGLTTLVGSIYWAFCVFRISEFLSYKTPRSKFLNRSLAAVTSLFYFPAADLCGVTLVLMVVALIAASSFSVMLSVKFPQPTLGWMITLWMLCMIPLIAVPFVGFPTLAIVWAYKFFVKLTLIDEPTNNRSFLRTRLPSIGLTILNIVGLSVGAYIYGNNASGDKEFRDIVALTWTLSSIAQAVCFYFLKHLISQKKRLTNMQS